jgi:type II restriction enzyme
MPTQASSEFITNREQGDWAEDLILRAINETRLNYVAVKYGKSEKRVTGEDGFEDFFNDYQQELDTIGKRPDILIFERTNYKDEWKFDISTLPMLQLAEIVPLAIAGVEIRSSSFLYDKYSESQEIELRGRMKRIMTIREQLLTEYKDILTVKTGWLKIIEEISPETAGIVKFKSPGWAATQRTKEAGVLIRDLKKEILAYQKRNHLSITPKVEDIKIVTKWIQTYKVPHYYFQVFFDKVFGIAFKDILELLADPANEDVKYFLESDVKNQNKTTIKINPQLGFLVAGKVDMPKHFSQMKELNRGRLLFYVTFEGGYAYLDIDSLLTNLNLKK